MNPRDHSLDGLPVTVVVVTFVVIVGTTLSLRFARRSWQAWYRPAVLVLLVWWAGVNVGHFGLGSRLRHDANLVLIALLIDPMRRTVRAALVPAKRDGRR